MKKNYKIVLAFILGILVSGTSVYAATKYLASEVTYKDKTVEKALNELYNKSGSSCDESLVGTTWDFNYSGKEDIFVAPCDGTYKLETWGAQGGSYNSTYVGGYGGYSVGYAQLKQIEKTYIIVGGAGTSGIANSSINYGGGGYNGGGSRCGYSCSGCSYYSSGGGGATHIATVSGLLSSLEKYKGTLNETSNTYDSSEILIVAGGGGGNGYTSGGWNINSTNISSGGGFIANNGNTPSNQRGGTGGTQVEGASFGQGANCGTSGVCDGGGGGFYGGINASSNAGGGSGFIGSSRLTSYNDLKKVMYCYNCTESSEEHTRTISTTNVSDKPTSNYAKKGHGYAKITLVSLK